MYVRVVRQNRAGTYLNRIAELVESGIAHGEGIRLPEPWSAFDRPDPDEQTNGRKEPHLPGKVVEMLQFFKTEHLLQMPLPPLASGKPDEVDILYHAVYVSAAVRRHAFLDWDEVAPLLVRIVWKTGQVAYIVVDSLDRRAGSVVSPKLVEFSFVSLFESSSLTGLLEPVRRMALSNTMIHIYSRTRTEPLFNAIK